MNLKDGNETDDDIMQSIVIMVKARVSIDPPSDILEIRAHFDYCNINLFGNSVYVIIDGGADSCINGQHAYDSSYTRRYANLIGYDHKVPIVSARHKARSSSTSNY